MQTASKSATLGVNKMFFLRQIYQWVWGVPTLVLILSVGVYLSLRTGLCQLRLLPKALRQFFSRFSAKREEADGVSSFQALCTALAATVGTGNLAGVAGALTLGGPGAIFWMWLCGLLGMVIKFAEATLAIHFRSRNAAGELVGGPMYMIRQGLPKRFGPLASIYALFGVVAAFGVGNATQVSTVISAVSHIATTFDLVFSLRGKLLLAAALALLLGSMLLGGAKRIGRATEALVPIAAVLYLLLGLTVLIARWQMIPNAFLAIFRGAFSPQAVTGGMVGSALIALRTGISRGVFTNEAGMGTASIAHASAAVTHPVEQGMMGIVEVFLDTIVICTITALVILVSGWPIPYGTDAGIELTNAAFSNVIGSWVSILLTVALCLFAIATVLGWGLYGLRCAQYLFGLGGEKVFALLQVLTIFLSALFRVDAVWLLAEIVNGLMAIPNLIALGALTPRLITIYKSYLHGGTYENFYQCQSL